MSASRLRVLPALLLTAALVALPGVPAGSAEATHCENGKAASYPCVEVDLLSHLSNAKLGGGEGNDIWGWTDPQTGREYALVGKVRGTVFVDVTEPTDPVNLGMLPSSTGSTGVLGAWRDIKVYEDHAYIVSEEVFHGVQIFDLTRLRGATSPQTWSEDAHYPLVGSTHNIAINEETGYAYALGSGVVLGVGGCSGLHMIDINEPQVPVFAGCFEMDGYTHDAQCVVYRGPDEDYTGREICMNSNEDTLTIVDVTNKLLPTQVARVSYPGAAYTHQGWFTEDQAYFLLGDEGDEGGSAKTRTYIWDVRNLDNPTLIGTHHARTQAIDHNMYTVGDLVYQANYRAGLQVYSLEDIAQGAIREVASFDIYPANDAASFNGAWSVYPYFESGTIVLNGIEQGLFVLRPRIADLSVSQTVAPDPAVAGDPLTYTLTVGNAGPYEAEGVTLTDALPLGVTFLSASAGCTRDGGVVTCDLGSLAAGDEATVTIEVKPNGGGQFTNAASVTFDGADHISSNDTSETTITAG